MGIIHKLPEDLVSKIAAGEVIERPASIVKELLENAVDAGADTITIELKNGGIDFIRVRDNGSGMLPEDIGLAIQRHATSKLATENDLYNIATLGFRGEALYSIGVIAELEIVTRHKNADMGMVLSVRGGDIVSTAKTAHDTGTTITVSNLFFNTPARKKFLGSPQSEYRACLDVIDRFVFGYPNTALRLVHNAKEVFTIQAASLEARAILRYDQELKGKLYKVLFDNSIIKVQGYVSDPDYTLNSSRWMYLFVNGRYIIDKSLNYTITNAYSTSLQKGRYPFAVLDISLPHHFLDVNINPTKTAVKFADKSMVYDAVGSAVHDAINKRAISYLSADTIPGTAAYRDEIKEAAESYRARHQQTTNGMSGFGASGSHRTLFSARTQGSGTALPREPDLQQTMLNKGEFSSLSIYAQFNATYIVASAPDSLVLIDQHAMHERILFEQLLRNSTVKQRKSQFLTVPQEIFLNEHRMSILAELHTALEAIGYGLTIGTSSVTVNAIPAGTVFTPLSLMEVMDNSMNVDGSSHTELTADQKTDPLYRIMADVACKSAVRAGDYLPVEKMKALFAQLDELNIPLNCPHGRPFVFLLSSTEIEKYFHRR